MWAAETDFYIPGRRLRRGGVAGDRGYIKNVELEQVCHARHGRGEEDRPSLIILYVRPESEPSTSFILIRRTELHQD
jgi:hypothetical protein